MNTTGVMNKIVDANSVGNGNFGSPGWIIPPDLTTNKSALTTADLGQQWLSQIHTELTKLDIPFKRSTAGLIVCGWKRIDWRLINEVVPSLWAAGCLEIFFNNSKLIHLSHAPGHYFQGAVVAMHELGHLHMDSQESHETQRNDYALWLEKWQKPNEIRAWQWAKQKMAGDWNNEAEHVALACLGSYDIELKEV